MGKDCVIGVDVGTMETKAVAFNNDGEEVGRGQREISINYPKHGWVEQDPEEIWSKTCSAIRDALLNAHMKPEMVRCISITGQRETVFPVNREGSPLYSAISWQDTRGWKICKILREDFGAEQIYKITGLPVNTMPSASKIVWIKNNEEQIYRKAWKFIGLVDYIVFKLSGKLKTDYSNANRTMLFDIKKLDWSDEILEFLKIDRDKMLDLIPSGSKIGELDGSSSELTGLEPGTEVVYGGGDQQCCALGVGVVKKRRVSCILGTCTNIEAFSEKIPFDQEMSLQAQVHVVPRAYLSEGGIGTSGVIYRWFRDNFGAIEMKVAEYLGESAYSIMDKEASKVEPGSEGLLLVPYFEGSLFPYWNAEDRGLLVGLTLRHSKAHIIRSILEGVAFEYRRMLKECERVTGLNVDTVRFMGGGSKSTLWTRIFVDVLGLKGEVPKVTEAGALGAAMLGMVSIGWYQNAVEAAEQLLKIERTIEVNVKNHEHYDKLYSLYRQIYDRVQDLINKISRLYIY